jgi:hypothetical protein
MCIQFDARMGEVRKVFMQLNREGFLSHKKHHVGHSWHPSYYFVYEKLKEDMGSGMDEHTMTLHKRAAIATGKDVACGSKINYKTEEKAIRAAISLNQKTNRPNFHKLEAYPCPFCNGWHIGREMSKEELEKFNI